MVSNLFVAVASRTNLTTRHTNPFFIILCLISSRCSVQLLAVYVDVIPRFPLSGADLGGRLQRHHKIPVNCRRSCATNNEAKRTSEHFPTTWMLVLLRGFLWVSYQPVLVDWGCQPRDPD